MTSTLPALQTLEAKRAGMPADRGLYGFQALLDELERGRRNFTDITWLSSHRARFACFCKEQADNKQYAIEKFNAQIDQLTATVG